MGDDSHVIAVQASVVVNAAQANAVRDTIKAMLRAMMYKQYRASDVVHNVV